MSRKIFFILFVCTLLIFLSACELTDKNNKSGLANPASVYCEENGGKVEIRTAEDGSQLGICVFPDGHECDEWEFFRGECE